MVTHTPHLISAKMRGFFILLAVATAIVLATSVRATHPGDQPPTIASVTVVPEVFGDEQTIIARVDANDPEGAPLSYIYQWFRNGVPIADATGLALDLSLPGNGDRGDTISVGAVANDGHSESSPALSPSYAVQNRAPSATVFLPYGGITILAGTDYQMRWEASDPDGDAANVEIWFRPSPSEQLVPIATVPLVETGYHWMVPNIPTLNGSLEFYFTDGLMGTRVVVGPIALVQPAAPAPSSPTPSGTINHPAIYNQVWHQIDPSTVEVLWDTDTISTGSVLFDTVSHGDFERAENYGYPFRVYEATPGNSHRVVLTGVEVDKTYYGKILSVSDAENWSGEFTFNVIVMTPPPPPPAPAPPPPPPPPPAPVAETPLVAPEPVLPPPAPAPEPPPPAPAPAPPLPPPVYKPVPVPAPALEPTPAPEPEPSLEITPTPEVAGESSVEVEVESEPSSPQTISEATATGTPVGATEPLSGQNWFRWLLGLIAIFVIYLIVRGFRKPEPMMISGPPSTPPPYSGMSLPSSPSGTGVHPATILPSPPPNA